MLLGDGRRLIGSSSFGQLTVDGVAVTVGEERYWSSFAPLADGFVAWSQKHTVLDCGGKRVVLERKTVLAKVAVWGNRVVFADWERTDVVSTDGRIATLPGATMVAACGALLVLGTDANVVFFDSELREVARVELKAKQLTPWGDEVLASGPSGLARVASDGIRWMWESEVELGEPIVVGARVVARSWSVEKAWILDGEGAVEASVDLAGNLMAAAPLGDGIVITTTRGHEASWWRPGGVERLAHDATPRLVGVLPKGVALAENQTLSVWRTDAEGPEFVASATDLPLGVPIISQVGGVVLEAHGRFASRGRGFNGLEHSVPHGTPWRHALTEAQARPLVSRLLERTPLPGALPSKDDAWSTEQELVMASHALFAPDALEKPLRWEAERRLSGFAEELGRALGVSERVLIAAFRAGRFPLEAPRTLKGWEYLGAFETEGKVTVSDPCAIDSKHTKPPLALALRLDVRRGTWHVYVLPGTGEWSDRTAELVCIHPDGFETFASELSGTIGIDSGTAGMFDARCPRPIEGLEEGVRSGRGAVATTGLGDGMYPVFVGRSQREVVKVRLHFLEPPDAEVDTSFAPKTGGGAYSAKNRYAVGDALSHPTFGDGVVVGVREKKVEVRFADGVRVLMHTPK